MGCKRISFLTVIFLLLNFSLGEIYAKGKSSKKTVEEDDAIEDSYDYGISSGTNYYVVSGRRDDTKVFQKLKWNEIPDIKCYKIVIEKKEGSKYVNVLEEELEKNFIEVSLEPGEYRFEITVINLFNRKKKSGWKEFKVFKAYIPHIKSVSPNPFYLNERKFDGEFTIEGENLLPESVFRIRNVGDSKSVAGEIISVSEDNKTAQVKFNLPKFDKGEYEISVINPGDFSDRYKKIFIKYKLITDIYTQFSAGYVFPVALYDGTIEKFADKKFFPISFAARLSVIGDVAKIGHIGVGVCADYSRLEGETRTYNFFGNDLNILANIIYQKFVIPEKLNLDIHVGVGMAMLFKTGFKYKLADYTSPDFKSLGLAIGGGFALQYYPLKQLYIEGGLDFIHANFKDMSFGTLRPKFSVGVMF